MKEIWKDIEGWEGMYQVSNLGNVKSYYNNKEKILKKYKNPDGYNIAVFWKKHKRYYPRVNRLVALAFIDNPENKPVVNHIDGNKLNNICDNLEWVTVKENHWHSRNKFNIFRHKVEINDVIEIRKLYKEQDLSYTSISKIYNITDRQVSYICNRKSWKHVA